MEEKQQQSRIPISLRGKSVDLWDAFYFHSLVTKWQPRKEVWPFVYGDVSISGLAAVSATYSGYWLRRNLRIMTNARISVYVSAVALSAGNSMCLQKLLITPDIIDKSRCKLCTYIKAAALQVVGGFLLPLAATSLICFYAADNLLTYPVPPIIKAPREARDLWLKIMRPRKRVFMVYGVVHAIAAIALTYTKEIYYDNLEILCGFKPDPNDKFM